MVEHEKRTDSGMGTDATGLVRTSKQLFPWWEGWQAASNMAMTQASAQVSKLVVEWLRHTINNKTKASYWTKSIQEEARAHGERVLYCKTPKATSRPEIPMRASR